MSRKFLDDNVELKLVEPAAGTSSILTLPKQAFATYDRGHVAVDPGTGIRLVNEGGSTSSLFVNERYNALIIQENFTTLPHIVANQSASFNVQVNLVGTNSADAGATFNTTQGGVTLTTTTASADQVIVQGNTNSALGSVSFIADNSLVFESQIVTSSAITSETIWVGLKLTNTSVTATDNDQTFFRYQNGVNSGKWQIIDSTGNVDNAQDSGVTVAVSTAYLLQIRVGSDRKPRYYINGVKVGTGAALTAATGLKPFVGIQTGTTAAKSITVRSLRVVQPRVPLAT